MILEEKTIVVNPSLTHEEMIECFNKDENIINFIGAIQCDVSILEKEVEFLEYTGTTWGEYAGYILSNDEMEVLINIGYPKRYIGKRCVSWGGKNDGSFLNYTKELGIENTLTKSEYVSILQSDNYKKESEL